jgi:hypothetical protein
LDPLRVVSRVIENAENIAREVFGNGTSHPRETLHEEQHGLFAIQVKGIASASGSSVLPWIEMVKPG